jgi:hypothetical protein
MKFALNQFSDEISSDLECSDLSELFEAATWRRALSRNNTSRQAGSEKSGAKSPHSKSAPALLSSLLP